MVKTDLVDSEETTADVPLSTAIEDVPIKPETTPLPWRELSVVLVIVFSEGFSGSFLLPFIGYMVIGFGTAPEQVGYYAGYITSSFFVAQFFSSFFLGYVSDMKGRRPIMLLGLAGNAITSAAFGVSTNLAWVLISRGLNGLINGNTGVVKSYVREITDDSNQARAYSIRSAGYAAGMIAGSVLGGVLARPSTQFPSVFSDTGLFATYPYLLPCLVSAILNAVGLVLGYFFLKETVAVAPSNSASEAAFSRLPSSDQQSDQPQMDTNEMEMVDLEPAGSVSDEEVPPMEEVDVKTMSFGQGLVYTGKQFMIALRTRAVLVTMLLYAVHAAVWLCFDEVFAVWALQSISAGGLEFQEKSIGIAHAISGVGMLFLQLFAYPALDKAVGSRRAFQITIGILAPASALMPFTNLLASGSSIVFLWICVGTLMAIKSAMGTGGMAAINLMINNASDPKSVGAINGLSASIAALSRLVAPTLGGSTYAWSLNNGLPFPLDFHFVFLVLGLVCVGMVVATQIWLDKTIDIRRKAR